jgi:multidrug efflux system outer membrane protein
LDANGQFPPTPLRFKQGVDNYLNVLVAQRSLYSSQQSLISAHLGN